MSQITRCPSCSTTFKVVADQLRISEGWVRCGQCKEVFDASAHLLAVAPAALLPDVSLTDVRPPPVPVPRAVDVGRVWGAPAAAGANAAPPRVPAPSSAPSVPAPAAGDVPPGDLPDSALPPWEPVAEADSPQEDAVPVLEVPQPAVPAFLSARGGEAAQQPPGLEAGLLDAFSWRPSAAPVEVQSGVESRVPGAENLVPPQAIERAGLPEAGAEPTTLPPLAAGYELPSATLPDDEELPPEPELAADPLPPIDPEPDLPAPAAVETEPPPAPVLDDGEALEPPAAAPGQGTATPLPPVDFVPAPPAPVPETLALVDERTPARVLRARTAKPSAADADAAPQGEDRSAEDEAPADHEEVSFVVAARRKAFWRRPLVRGVLVLLVLASLAGLGLQVAVQERDRLAAMNVRLQPWLLALCEPLRCEVAPYRQIADVVIDSSSFNKARGDSYQLALTMKNLAAIPVATPAVELTLTDAQDQPVLRRVLLPADLGASGELPARGEWNASVSVLVTTGGARVAGYRLLAFYP
ncbi:DUF3426 domain-containing protein [Acidovorax sp. M2(2025)]|uniref:DUF3426 domain-containing protein n=1 Tax=Acidovorax sp. M2(2025) TaxID=3411355 RepID=UPI003BF5174E